MVAGVAVQAALGFLVGPDVPAFALVALWRSPSAGGRGGRAHTCFEGYVAVLEALERTLRQVAALTRSLDKWSADEDRYRYGAFLASYADFLESRSRITRVFADLDEDRLGDQTSQLHQLADEAQNYRRRPAEQAEPDDLSLTDPGRPYLDSFAEPSAVALSFPTARSTSFLTLPMACSARALAFSLALMVRSFRWRHCSRAPA